MAGARGVARLVAKFADEDRVGFGADAVLIPRGRIDFGAIEAVAEFLAQPGEALAGASLVATESEAEHGGAGGCPLFHVGELSIGDMERAFRGGS